MGVIWSILKLLFFRWRYGNGIVSGTSIQDVLGPFRRGDYETALEATEGLLADGAPNAPYCFFRGAILMHLGQLDESERWLRKGLTMKQDDKQLSLNYSSLGQMLLVAGRYQEAMDCFASSVRHWPDHGPSYRDMAEAWLLRGNNPAEALRLAKQAVEMDRTGKALSDEVYDLNLSESLATLAWAVAVTARDSEQVERLVSEALPLTGDDCVSTPAQVHVHCGRAYVALGNLGKAVEHFEEATRIDPQGHWGRSARAMATGQSV